MIQSVVPLPQMRALLVAGLIAAAVVAESGHSSKSDSDSDSHSVVVEGRRLSSDIQAEPLSSRDARYFPGGVSPGGVYPGGGYPGGIYPGGVYPGVRRPSYCK